MRAWHLSYPLVWAVVFIRYKAMREAYQWIRTVSSHTLLFIIKSRTEGTGRRNKKYKKKIILIALSIVTLCGCESKFEKKSREVFREAEEYADALDNAKSKEEVRALRQAFKDLDEKHEKEFEELKKDVSFQEIQELIQDEDYIRIKNKVKESERNARKRFN